LEFESIAIAANTVEVIPTHAKSYTVTVEEAKVLVRNGAKWKGRNKVYLDSDRIISAPWSPRQSGYAGPLVMQMQT
jgi:hypothetical protein